MQLHKIEAGNFMADGGAVFGVVPKVMWEKKYPCNSQNYCNLSLRCLLVKTENRVVLIDTGIGNKQSEKFFSYHHLNGDDSLEKSFDAANISFEEVTDVILTHLHFDHCGGAVQKDDDGNLSLTFPNAAYWLSEAQWHNFNHANVREGSVYFKENILPVLEEGRLKLIKDDTWLTQDIELRLFHGHTKGQIIPFVKYMGKTLVFTADLIPVMASIPEAWVASYDIDPVTSMNEKRDFLNEALQNNYILLFEHDLYNECCYLKQADKGITNSESFKLEEIK
ncbi:MULTISPECIES: MBL fold metallo-hydrolase [unclassified Saccharicrinis]|uniref:MBL fold metallo-hydrolase n=1 Tax=unclassified Saccharicrinis TaxID=2646859 RepID=UPI003D34D4EC